MGIEYFTRGRITYKSDVFAAGVFLHCMLAGEYPFEGSRQHNSITDSLDFRVDKMHSIVHDDFCSDKLGECGVSEKLVFLVEGMLEKLQVDRLRFEEVLDHPVFRDLERYTTEGSASDSLKPSVQSGRKELDLSPVEKHLLKYSILIKASCSSSTRRL